MRRHTVSDCPHTMVLSNGSQRRNSWLAVASNIQNKANSPSVEAESPFLKLTPLRRAILLDHVKGLTTQELAKKYKNALVPRTSEAKGGKLKQARNRLRDIFWTQAFRDALWDYSMMGLDLHTPNIVAGVARKGAAGDVQAARLAFELTGRHAPNSDIQPAQVQIVLGNIPRPELNAGIDREADIDADAELIEDDEDIL